MARKIEITTEKTLNKEVLKDDLNTMFSSFGYEVYLSSLIGADVVIKKNNWIGASVKLKTKSDKNYIVISGFSPSTMARILVSGVLPILILLPKWLRFEKEIEGIIKEDQAIFNT
ncbi:hypothetical protein [Aquimarina sp. AU58]|uniref:hypothetical protein n=1 Tax=Aquimarina sp. AU58 TaxID=1874112 RepID=UPI000D642067|nr:hypothetical protein [Aquimarina sp. AU58]